jgi:hypothetical protein
MSSIGLKFAAVVIGIAVAAVSIPADAAKRIKHRVVRSAQAEPLYRGTNKFPAGPIYNARTYLGDDPDPFIRSQLARDVNAIYGGNN